jgi:hypothetical protein
MGNSNFTNLNRTLGEMLARAGDLSKPLAEIGMFMSSEMKKNFDEGGRPDTWPESQRVQRHGGQTLRDSGTLRNSIDYEVTPDGVNVGPSAVGRKHLTDPRILAALNFGAEIQHYQRQEIFFRKRKSRGIHKGQFKTGTEEDVGLRGMKFGAHATKLFPYNYTYVPDDASETMGQILCDYIIRQPS